MFISCHYGTRHIKCAPEVSPCFIAASPCFDARPGQRGGQRHVGWQAAEVAPWQRLHEDLHATTQVLAELASGPHVATQVPAWLAGLAAAWEWRWGLGAHGLGRGLVDVVGKGLAGGPSKGLVAAPWSSPVRVLPEVSSSGPYLTLCVNDLHKDLHATMEVPLDP